MQKSSNTYRLIAALTGFLILAGASVPSGLHAKHFMAGHCEMPQKAVPAPHDDCAMMDGTGHLDETKSRDHHGDTADTDCDLGFACGCSIGEAPVKTQAVQLFSKTFGGFYPVAIDFTGEIKTQSRFAGHSIETEAIAASPPLFLKNATFLN